jgi:hypothetical protein
MGIHQFIYGAADVGAFSYFRSYNESMGNLNDDLFRFIMGM